MSFCTKCGKNNDDDAAFCKFCGAPIPPAKPEEGEAPVAEEKPPMYPPGYEYDRRGYRGPPRRDFDKECEQECQEGSRENSWIWGVIVVLVGLFIVFEAGIKNIDGVPDWVRDIQIWWIIPILIGILIISFGLRLMSKTGR